MQTDATNPNIRTSLGSATYAPENDALIWKIRSFPGGKVWIYLHISVHSRTSGVVAILIRYLGCFLCCKLQLFNNSALN